jgi:hypothetical protein
MTILTVALFSAFFLVVLKEFIYMGVSKAAWAFGFSTIGYLVLWSGTLNENAVKTVASAFLAITIATAAEKLAEF